MNEINPHFPVNILLYNSSQLFEIISNKYELQDGFNKGLSKKLGIICCDSCINDIAEIKEHFDDDNKKYYRIYVWDNYCQFLWIICYSIIVFMDELIIKPILNSAEKRNEQLLETSFNMFKAGMSLYDADPNHRSNRSVFFDFPNPVRNKDDENIKSANLLFEAALCFILFHEFSHLELGHLEKENLKDDELAADFNAFYSMYGDQSLGVRKYFSLGIIIALGSLFFADNKLDGGTHPDPDDRLGQILNNMDDLDAHGKDYCYGLATTIYKMWAHYYELEFIIPKVDKVENFKEYFGLIQRAFHDYKYNRK